MTQERDIVARLRSLSNALAMGEWIALTETCATAADEIETLRAERDEARREACRLIVAGDFSVHENVTKEHVAFERGWDCFKGKP